jgi:hypothetical protein
MPVMQPLGGECAWRGSELLHSDRWRRRLCDAHLSELGAALTHLKKTGVSPEDITRSHFPLHDLNAELASILSELEHGCGMVHLGGFPVGRYSDADLRLMWIGLCTHMGGLRLQNRHGELLREIRDEGADRGERYGQLDTGSDTFLSSRARVASTGELRFHTDRADMVALLCVRPAKEGGLTRIASSVAVHDEMLRRRPDLAALLYENIHRSRLGEEAGGESSTFPLPVFDVYEGRFTSHYSRTYVEAAQLLPGVPALSGAHWEALDLLAELCAELCLDVAFEPGDVQFLNSHVTYHARTPYEDHAEPDRKRLLYRLWICPEDKRPLSPGQAVLWGRTGVEGLRGGIGQG